MKTPTRHRVVIVGGGFGGVYAAKALKRAPVDVTLIDRTNHHLFQPLLYQVATGILSPGEIAPALRSMFRRQSNVRVLLADVRDVDVDARTVHATALHRELAIPYDTLIVAAGATHSYFGRDDWAAHAPGMKTLDDAHRLRSRILGAFELAEAADDAEERRAWTTFAIVGAGPTGVELTGQVAVLAKRILRGEFRSIDSAQARIVLVDAGPAVLASFDPKLQARAARDLRAMGVDIRLETRATHIDEDGIHVTGPQGDDHVAAKTVIWAAGVQASPLARLLADATGAEVDRAGRVAVEPDCTLPGRPEVFAIGDMASLNGLPGVAQPAMQEGKFVAKVIRARLRARPAPSAFEYVDKGSMATIGRTSAVADAFGVKLRGFPAYVTWAFVHVMYLVGWGSRIGTMFRWLWGVLARNRRERLITVVSLVSDDTARAELRNVAAAYAKQRRPAADQ